MIRKWFFDFENFLRKENLLDILDDPRRIANADEAAFLLEARQGSIKLIAPTGMEDFYLARTGNQRRAITCLATLTASGYIILLAQNRQLTSWRLHNRINGGACAGAI